MTQENKETLLKKAADDIVFISMAQYPASTFEKGVNRILNELADALTDKQQVAEEAWIGKYDWLPKKEGEYYCKIEYLKTNGQTDFKYDAVMFLEGRWQLNYLGKVIAYRLSQFKPTTALKYDGTDLCECGHEQCDHELRKMDCGNCNCKQFKPSSTSE